VDLLDASSSGQWPYSKDEVFDALSLATLKVPGLRIDSRDREAGQLVVQGPKGLLLPGERITISVQEVYAGTMSFRSPSL
jgi:hypothetical protein